MTERDYKHCKAATPTDQPPLVVIQWFLFRQRHSSHDWVFIFPPHNFILCLNPERTGGDTARSTIPRSHCLHKPALPDEHQQGVAISFLKTQSKNKLSNKDATWNIYPGVNTPRPRKSYHTTPDRRVHVSTTCLLHVPHQPNPNRLQTWTATLDVHAHHNMARYITKPTNCPIIGNQ